MNVRVYDDPDLEALRVAITDAEILQAIGRGRGVNRTADAPLTVWLMADVLVSLPVDHLVQWADVRLSLVQRMLAHGAILLSPTDAAREYPDLFKSAQTARKGIERSEKHWDIPLLGILNRGMSQCFLREVSYRFTGNGQQIRRALVAPEQVAGFRDRLEELGDLAHYEVAPLPAEAIAMAPPAPRRRRSDPAARSGAVPVRAPDLVPIGRGLMRAGDPCGRPLSRPVCLQASA